MAIVEKTIILTEKNDAGPLFDVYWSADCSSYNLLTASISLPAVSSSALIYVDDTASCIKLVSKGVCTNEVISGSFTPGTTTTTTAGPTTSTTTTTTTSTTTSTTSTTTSTTSTTTTVATLSVEYLMVAGGGGGGSRHAGAGGAGGYISGSTALNTNTIYPIVIGAGGAGFNSDGELASVGPGQPGNNTTFISLTAVGGGKGGGGATNPDRNGGNGGSGGGEAPGGVLVGLGTSGQGNNGGNGVNYAAGGGGGASTAGTDGTRVGTNNFGGAGGSGSLWLNGNYYAGGGGGGVFVDAVGGDIRGLGGIGGGGNGGQQSNGANGTANTGGGGGGAGGYSNQSYDGGNGGSGIVIVRYLGSPVATGGTITENGGYTYHTFTSSGNLNTSGGPTTTTTTTTPGNFYTWYLTTTGYGTSNEACAGGAVSTVVYTDITYDEILDFSNFNTRFYTDTALTTPFDGNGDFWGISDVNGGQPLAWAAIVGSGFLNSHGDCVI